MRICRFDDDRLGIVIGDEVVDVSEACDSLPNLSWPLPFGDPLVRALDELRPRLNALSTSGKRVPLSTVRLRSPVATPSKIMAAPVNYKAHQAEANVDQGISFGSEIKTIEHYGLFLKASSSLVGPSDGVVLPELGRRVDHEIELAVVIGKSGFQISRREARQHIAGYAIGLDMTIRGQEDRSWRKSYEFFAVLGPWLVTSDEVGDPNSLAMSLKVDGVLRQSANTSALIFDVDRLIEYASSAYRLYPGDIIMTGTPEGVGTVDPGQTMDCIIDGIGEMRVYVGVRG